MGLLGNLAKGLNFENGFWVNIGLLLPVLYACESLNIQYFPSTIFLLPITLPMVL